ncbi:MAG TPA: protein kinase [Gemmatimonadaceae bacterium]
MANALQDQLQSALSGTYSLERELGGGGMSRVFLAHEVALGRRVVVKVLPPEMAASVNIERFRREIQLAASLQHPHIVPLHAAGQAGDLLYYTMPFVEGESLRAKLAREGELPIATAVRILKDVVDALAYAHAHGVVHRDIKPDNILISGHHAVVTDFGVAKAVSAASSSDSSVTSLGVALGTPAYMAPEQAVADPDVDQRADLYAAGVVAYEMLCGSPPFSGMPPQQVLAAHVTQQPEPITARRAMVPPALGALIMRCLAKKPADRVQSADDLLARLEAMTTPSAGTTPSGARPATSSGAEAELRRAHPARVLVLFTAAAVALLALVYLLMIRLGLPTWVFVAAIVLLLVGLPIMLLTGLRERARTLARTSGTSLPPPRGVEHLFTWRRAIMGGVMAFAALATVAAVYTAMRVLGIGPVGTLVAEGALEERQPIILADFENRASDSTLGVTLTEAFRVDLSQSHTVRLVSTQSIGDALRRMQRSPQTALTPAMAREVAQREGIKAVVAGQIDPVGTSYLLSARVISAVDGSTLTAVRETAANEAALIHALDRLSSAMRERMGESLVTIRANEPLASVTTGSLDALRKYTQALRLADEGDQEGAIRLLQDATAADPGFAMAWRKLAAMLGNIGASKQQVVEASTNAFKHRDRLPELERALTEAFYYFTVDYDPAKAIAANRAALDVNPNSDIALVNLPLVYMDQRRYAAAESLLERGVARGLRGPAHINLIWAQLFQGKEAAAESTWNQFASASPNDPALLETHGFMESARFNYAAAERDWTQLRAWPQPSLSLRERAAGGLALVNLVQGKLALATRHANDMLSAAEERGLIGNYLTGEAVMAAVDVRFRDQPDVALERVASALKRHPLSSVQPIDRPYPALARFYAEAGRPDEARRLLAEYTRAVPAGIRRIHSEQYGAEGAIAIAENRPQDAITAFRRWNDESGCGVCGLSEIAAVYQKAQQPDSALAYYEKFAAAHAPERLVTDAFALAPAYQRLGELYEKRGDRAKALEYYRRFVALWKNADPELQPIVRDVRARMGRLA